MPVSPSEIRVYETLNRLSIPFERFEHPPVTTVAEAQQFDDLNTGGHCKILFLRDKKGIQYFLVILLAETVIDLSSLAKHLECGRLGFASQRLYKILVLLPGSFGSFGLINDHYHLARVIIDKALLLEEKAGFHPNANTATLVVKVTDLQIFIRFCGSEFEIRFF